MQLFSTTLNALERSLDVSSQRQKVISSNIANVDTPQYKAKDVSFRSELQKALDNKNLKSYQTNDKHIPFSTQQHRPFQPQVVTQTGTLYNHNGNNVDLDLEMTKMAENQLWYNALTDRANGKLNSLRTVISEGR
ncbi:flagellar basal body rod protein FlgB [Caldalkalibacillus salinus]|uniref:flagellar basal body rod protein FlgB n=1 Tax=Caldalkalibacillus salinus TaxID=2803787 RepID=UPI001922B9DE|nr:flagellar basal body rod protein FlgB [Caldalkalibacillus salinus]